MEKGINDLPVDIWILIFRRLSIKDLLNCRLVNKKFKNFSDFTDGINKLIIDEPNSDLDDYYWYYNNKQIKEEDIISLKCLRAIKKLSIFNLDINLKYLKIYNKKFKLEELLNLINLQSIEFGSYYKNDNQQILNLNNLKVFASKGRSVQLNTPKLEKIQFNNINKIKLNNSESIKHLITRNYDNKFEIFKNLEIMELRGIYQPEINENLLIIFKNLKQLKINLFSLNYSNERIKNSLIKILNDKIKLKRSIDIYLEGVKIENIDKFNELVSIGDSIWKFRLDNYDLLDSILLFIRLLRYEELEGSFKNIKKNLPSSFFDKFIHINYVSVSSVKDFNNLNWFLGNLKYLNRLVIHTRLNQDFYDNLPNTINKLRIYNRRNINYEFILKLSKLNSFYTLVDKDLFDLAFSSFFTLIHPGDYYLSDYHLEKFCFYFKGKKITIVKEKGKNAFYLNDDKKRKLDYNKLVEECNKIRSK